MSVARLFRYLMGLVIAIVLLVIGLPFVGIPSSHFLPPNHVYARAQGEARGVITGKYYDTSGNPFHVGDREYFANYRFAAHAPGPHGEPSLGPVQVYTGTARVDKSVYDDIGIAIDKSTADKYTPDQVIPASGQVIRVRYEKTYPYINGIDAEWGGRNIGPGSNILSGWIIWIVVALFLGYLIMMLLERAGNKENI